MAVQINSKSSINDTRNWQVSLADPSRKVEGIEDIAQCVYIILTTIKGSDPLRPDFGSDVCLFLDRPVNEVQAMLVYSVTKALQRWEKRIQVQRCRLLPGRLEERSLLIEALVLASESSVTITVNI
jgi:phage baseplate assembly protein W